MLGRRMFRTKNKSHQPESTGAIEHVLGQGRRHSHKHRAGKWWAFLFRNEIPSAISGTRFRIPCTIDGHGFGIVIWGRSGGFRRFLARRVVYDVGSLR